MEKRTLTILAIRPQLNIAVDNATEIEKFQNLTLRPILKFQHNLLTFQFQMYIDPQFNFKSKSKSNPLQIVRCLNFPARKFSNSQFLRQAYSQNPRFPDSQKPA